MPEMFNNQEFELSTNRDNRTAAIAMSAGSAKLQCLCGTNPGSDTWVDVPNSTVSASTVFTFHQSRGLKYRWVLSGDARVFLSD